MVSGYKTLGKLLGNEGEIVTSGIRHFKRWSERDLNPNKANNTKSCFQRNHSELHNLTSVYTVFPGLQESQPQKLWQDQSVQPLSWVIASDPYFSKTVLVHRKCSSPEGLWMGLSHRFTSLSHGSRFFVGLLGCPEYP